MRHQPWKFAETIRDGRCSIVHEAVKEVEEGNVGIGQLEKKRASIRPSEKQPFSHKDVYIRKIIL